MEKLGEECLRKKKVQIRTKKTCPSLPPASERRARSSQHVPWWKSQCDLRHQPSVWADVVSEKDSVTYIPKLKPLFFPLSIGPSSTGPLASLKLGLFHCKIGEENNQ